MWYTMRTLTASRCQAGSRNRVRHSAGGMRTHRWQCTRFFAVCTGARFACAYYTDTAHAYHRAPCNVTLRCGGDGTADVGARIQCRWANVRRQYMSERNGDDRASCGTGNNTCGASCVHMNTVPLAFAAPEFAAHRLSLHRRGCDR